MTTPKFITDAREAMLRAGCSSAEADLLIRTAIASPPHGSKPHEAVTAMALAMSIKPEARHGLIELARLPREDRERVQEIERFSRDHLPRFNVGFPHSANEFAEAFKEWLHSLWPERHESCINGAILIGIGERRDRGGEWTINSFAIVKCMRETAQADRTMRYGYGR